jgi:hypothetical protein
MGANAVTHDRRWEVHCSVRFWMYLPLSYLGSSIFQTEPHSFRVGVTPTFVQPSAK